MKVGLRWFGRAAVAVVVIGLLALEVRHVQRYGHLFGYGWHVDVLSDRADYPLPGIEYVQYVKVTNFSLLPGSIDTCIMPNDIQPHETPVVPARIQILERATGQWRSVRPDLRNECPSGRVTRKRIWPLMSFYTEPTFVAATGKRGDWVRLMTFSAFDNGPGPRREFLSPPFQLTEEPEPYTKYSVSIRSLSFCEPVMAKGKADGVKGEDCRKLVQWRESPDSPHPAVVDVVCEIENTGTDTTSPDDFLVLTTLDVLVAPATQYHLVHLDTLPSTVSWGRDISMDDVKLAVVKWLKSGERRIVHIPGFDLRPLLRGHDSEDGLWNWWIRVNVRIESRSGDRLAVNNAILPLIPSPNRVANNIGGPVEDHNHLVRRIRIAPRPRPLW